MSGDMIMRECCVDNEDGWGYCMPAQSMGEYEKPKPSKKKPKPVGLYPLPKEGTYGPPPSYVPPLPGYTRRGTKPKAYAAYSINRPPVPTIRLPSLQTAALQTVIGRGKSEECFRSERRREWTQQAATTSGISHVLSYFSMQTVVEIKEGLEEVREEEMELEEEEEDGVMENINGSKQVHDEQYKIEGKHDITKTVVEDILKRKYSTSTQEI